MKLTNKCKEDFEKWRTNKGLENFNPKKFSLDVAKAMTYGVLVDFFDSVGIYIISKRRSYRVSNGDNIYSDLHLTRQEARIKSIQKANELYNEL